jgi:hypothetical protein
MIFKLYNCDLGIKYNGVNYDFEHVEGLTVEDPESTKLIRGANAGNKTGLAYKEGLKDAKKITVTIIGMSAALKSVLQVAYDKKDRLDVYCVDRDDGSSKIAKNAILSQQPQQLSLSDGADSMNVALVFESFDISEVHKS